MDGDTVVKAMEFAQSDLLDDVNASVLDTVQEKVRVPEQMQEQKQEHNVEQERWKERELEQQQERLGKFPREAEEREEASENAPVTGNDQPTHVPDGKASERPGGRGSLWRLRLR